MICIISHDAGGAEILSSLVRRSDEKFIFVLEGPAVAIFKRKVENLEIVPFDVGISSSDLVYCGTSWQSDLERLAMRACRKAGKRCVAFLDHWVNYEKRFFSNGFTELPDQIRVGDEFAYAMARDLFPETQIELEPNPYFLDIQAEVEAIRESHVGEKSVTTFLYVTEPTSEHAMKQFGDPRYWGYDEFEALERFLGSAPALFPGPLMLILRPHPAEELTKFDNILRSSHIKTVVNRHDSLLDSVVKSDVVVGCDTMAMVVGVLAGKRVICSIPKGGKRCSLPYPEIEIL